MIAIWELADELTKLPRVDKLPSEDQSLTPIGIVAAPLMLQRTSASYKAAEGQHVQGARGFTGEAT